MLNDYLRSDGEGGGYGINGVDDVLRLESISFKELRGKNYRETAQID